MRPCVRPPGLIATVLLTYGDRDDERAFSARLLVNTAISEQLVGFVNTFHLLGSLVDETRPERVRHTACRELAKWYALEFPRSCLPLVAGSATEADRLDRAVRLRQELGRAGMTWVHDRIHSTDVRETTRYLEILANSAERETRDKAKELLRKDRA